MSSLKGSETEKNLLKSFAGESQARNRYTFFASVAKKEGYEQIAAIFLETAANEKEHAEVFFKHMVGGDLEIIAEYPAGKIGDTAENLLAAAEGELLEWGTLYPDFEEVAKKEGFKAIAKSFEEIAEVEEQHESVQEGHQGALEMQELRIRPRRQGASPDVSRMPARPELL
jgi:rubrerythrin